MTAGRPTSLSSRNLQRSEALMAHRYTATAIVLHWAIAICILFNLSLGFFMEEFPPALRKATVGLHVSSGMTVLVLVLLRLGWRLSHRPPPFPRDMKPWEQRAAHLAHASLYVLMFAMPISGFIFMSAHPPRPGAGIHVWGLLNLPPIAPIAHLPVDYQKYFHDRWVSYHGLGACLLIGLLLLHVAGALKHQWLDGHAELARIGLGRRQ
jgi:cytochrome b561